MSGDVAANSDRESTEPTEPDAAVADSPVDAVAPWLLRVGIDYAGELDLTQLWDIGVRGAVLADLWLTGRISNGGESLEIDTQPTGIRHLDAAIGELVGAGAGATELQWLERGRLRAADVGGGVDGRPAGPRAERRSAEAHRRDLLTCDIAARPGSVRSGRIRRRRDDRRDHVMDRGRQLGSPGVGSTRVRRRSVTTRTASRPPADYAASPGPHQSPEPQAARIPKLTMRAATADPNATQFPNSSRCKCRSVGLGRYWTQRRNEAASGEVRFPWTRPSQDPRAIMADSGRRYGG
jgi:hypothetical protein